MIEKFASDSPIQIGLSLLIAIGRTENGIEFLGSHIKFDKLEQIGIQTFTQWPIDVQTRSRRSWWNLDTTALDVSDNGQKTGDNR